MKTQNTPQVTYLKDYLQPDFLVKDLDLRIELGEEKTLVTALLDLCRNFTVGKHQRPLRLMGEALKLISIKLNDRLLLETQYELTVDGLILSQVPDVFFLEIITEIYPQKNTALTGLYRSGQLYCTQCEAQGFRRITYYLDRPDVMAPFTTTIIADKTRYPLLLSNGNKVGEGELDNHRHWVKWHDPFRKPSYLFALVAGDLYKKADTFTTMSGRKVALEIFVEHENKNKCEHALTSLKKAMQWDEENYAREYDLDIYMIVAVNDFNMGAMENKGLNIFNSKYVLANEETATDKDYQNIESVVGHEYFHNWTGNRITCRDWFQLSLKEGLTVFREQQFSSDMGSPIVNRIDDVRIMRTRQFAEDAGPMAHPVRPESYIEINNFYTSTVYNKGAEVIRMLRTLLGKQGFRAGMDLYFARYDGQAVTIEDFIGAFADANNIDLNQFCRWYQQAGTPEVTLTSHYDEKQSQYKLTLSQFTPITADKKDKKPFLIPIKFALYDNQGKKIEVGSNDAIHHTLDGDYLILEKAEQTWHFAKVPPQSFASLLGGFSAPVKLKGDYSQAQLELMMAFDEDLFNRWDAAQRISTKMIIFLMNQHQHNQSMNIPDHFSHAYQRLLKQPIEDPALLAQMMILPSFQYIAEELPSIPVQSLIISRNTLVSYFAKNLQEAFFVLYQKAKQQDDGSLSTSAMGYRALKNTCLSYLIRAEHSQGQKFAQDQYTQARNMTDRMGVLSALNVSNSALQEELFEKFYVTFKSDPLVVNKWLGLHACSEDLNVLEKVQSLLKHEAFDIGNPNKVYALINTFAMSNPEGFHDAAGKGYQFLADQVIELNQRNPQVAARLLEALTQWRRLDQQQGNLMKQALLKIQQQDNLSEDVFEIVSKSLLV